MQKLRSSLGKVVRLSSKNPLKGVTINGITYESLKCRFVNLLRKFRFHLNDFC